MRGSNRILMIAAILSVLLPEVLRGTGGQPPICDTGGPYGGLIGFPIEFDGTGSTDPDGTIVTYEWSFGDGASGEGPTPSHTYNDFGPFTAILTVTDDTQLASSCSTTVDLAVDNMPPICDADGPYFGQVGLEIQFDGTGSLGVPPHMLIAYEWDFGDGGNGIGPTPTHTYFEAGKLTVTLTVTDDNAQTSTCTTTASVTLLSVEPTTWGAIKNQWRSMREDVERAYHAVDDLDPVGMQHLMRQQMSKHDPY